MGVVRIFVEDVRQDSHGGRGVQKDIDRNVAQQRNERGGFSRHNEERDRQSDWGTNALRVREEGYMSV